MELEMSMKNCSVELVESKLNVSEDEIKGLKRKNDDLEKKLVNITKEEEEVKFQQLMMENSVLESEKKMAESEVEAWKAKCNELEMRVLELQKQLQLEKETDLLNLNDDKDPRVEKLAKHCVDSELGNGGGLESRDRKKNLSPSAPGVRPSVEISDSDDNLNCTKIKKKRVTNRVTSDDHVDPVDLSDGDDNQSLSKTRKRKASNIVTSDSENDDHVDTSDRGDDLNPPKTRTRKANIVVSGGESEDDDHVDTSDRGGDLNPPKTRTRKANIVVSEGEDDVSVSKLGSTNPPSRNVDAKLTTSMDDSLDETLNKRTRKRRLKKRCESEDDVPIGKLRSRRPNPPACNIDTKSTSSMNDSFDENHNKSSRRGRLSKSGKKICEVSKFVDDDNEKDEDDLETDSSGDFIDDGPVASEDHSASDSKEISESNGISSGESQNESENSISEIMSNLGRKKKQKVVGDWECEPDMLADFGKNSELCMEAVCAMCRHDTVNGHLKGEGFNMYDGSMCYELALFITGGHLDGEVKKTVEELENCKPDGTENCRHYATKYSRQLFEVYKSGEDPYFNVDHLVSILNISM